MTSASSYPPLGAAPVSSQSDPSVPRTLKHTHTNTEDG